MNAVPLKPVCVGRLLIKVPERSNINWTASFDRSEVARIPLDESTTESFWETVEKRKSELEALPHDTESSQLGLYQTVGENAAIILFRDSTHRVSSYKMDRYLRLKGAAFRFETGSWPNKIKSEVQRNSQIFSKLSAHDARGNPVGAGFCIDGAAVIGDIGQIEAGLTVDLPQWKHTSLSIGTFELLPPAEEPTSAFQDLKDQQEGYSNAALRSPEVRQEPLYAKEFDILRKRERSVGGFAGQEAAWRKTLVNGAQVYQFIWQSQEPNGTPSQPGLVIQLSAGLERKPEDPPPPEEDLLALWDAVLQSPRLR